MHIISQNLFPSQMLFVRDQLIEIRIPEKKPDRLAILFSKKEVFFFYQEPEWVEKFKILFR
jgi:hypothetical protein